MHDSTPFLVGAALVLAFLAFRVAGAYSTLAVVEKVVLWWWVTICAVVVVLLAGDTDPEYPAIGIAGVLMVGLGLFIVLNVGRVADRLGARPMALGPLSMGRSARGWRVSGGFLILIGAIWSLALL